MANQYRDLVNMILCNSDSKQCMIHRCSKCPGIDNVKESLLEIFVNKEELSLEEIESGDESDRENEILEEAISFKQWITADRSELLTQTASVEEFIDILCGQLDNITTHSFVAKSQANYLKTLKEEIKQEEVIVLGDFSENFCCSGRISRLPLESKAMHFTSSGNLSQIYRTSFTDFRINMFPLG